MKKLHNYLMNSPLLFILSCAFCILYSATIPLLSLIMEWITNGLLVDKQFGYLQIAVCLLFIFSIFTVRWLNVYIKSLYLNKCVQKLKLDYFENIFHKNIKEFRDNEISLYISFLNNDVYVLENDFFGNFFEILSGILSVIFSIVILGSISIKITIVLCIIILLCIALPNLFGKRLGELKNHYLNNAEKIIGFIKDYLNGFEVIKIFDSVSDVTMKFRKRNRILEESRMKASIYSSKIEVLMNTSSYVLGIGMFGVCAYMVSRNEINYGQMVAVVQLSNSIMNPLMMVFLCVGRLISSLQIWKRSQYMFDCKNMVSNNNGSISLNNSIHINNVSFKYDNSTEFNLKNINLKFYKGKKYAIVGASGSGKTTILKLILKFYSDYSGNILLDDVNYNEIDDQNIYGLISYIQQDIVVFNENLLYNITLGKEYSEDEINNAIKLSGLTSVINNLDNGLESFVGENGGRFSGGEKQRIALCRAVLKSSELIVLDEMTTGLDYQTASEIEKSILGLDNKTLIAVTHQTTPELMKMYDEIIVLQDGEIVEVGSFEKLLSNNGCFVKLIKQ